MNKFNYFVGIDYGVAHNAVAVIWDSGHFNTPEPSFSVGYQKIDLRGKKLQEVPQLAFEKIEEMMHRMVGTGGVKVLYEQINYAVRDNKYKVPTIKVLGMLESDLRRTPGLFFSSTQSSVIKPLSGALRALFKNTKFNDHQWDAIVLALKCCDDDKIKARALSNLMRSYHAD